MSSPARLACLSQPTYTTPHSTVCIHTRVHQRTCPARMSQPTDTTPHGPTPMHDPPMHNPPCLTHNPHTRRPDRMHHAPHPSEPTHVHQRACTNLRASLPSAHDSAQRGLRASPAHLTHISQLRCATPHSSPTSADACGQTRAHGPARLDLSTSPTSANADARPCATNSCAQPRMTQPA